MADEEPKSMDIAKPGAQAPSKTSRPIINKHKMVQDPMVKDDPKPDEDSPKNQESEQGAKDGSTLSSQHKTIAPLESQNFDEQQDSTEKSEKTDEPAPEKPPEETAAGEKTDKTAETSEADDKSKEENAIVGAVINQAAANKDKDKDPGNQDVEDIEKQKKIEKLIEDKTYFLPVGEVTRRKQNKQALLVLIPLLLLVVVYVLADLGVLPLPFDLPVEFFRGR